MKHIRFLALIAVLAACNNSANNNPAVAGKSNADSVMDQVMKAHDVGMAKHNKIEATQKRIRQVIDSISRLPANAQKRSLTYKIQLDSVARRLASAGNAMENWMNEFNMDSSLSDMDQRIKYLESEQTKISKIKDDMISSLQQADSVLGKK